MNAKPPSQPNRRILDGRSLERWENEGGSPRPTPIRKREKLSLVPRKGPEEPGIAAHWERSDGTVISGR